jgi:hypothetical protein
MRIRTTTAPHATPPPNPYKYSNIQQSWRVARGDSAPLSVTGLLSGGVWIRVYGGLVVTDRGSGADLEPDATDAIPLAALRHVSTVGQVRA